MSTDSRPILVVDDDQAVRDVVLTVLLLEGYPVREAANGAEALRMIEDEEPSLILLDMQMPEVDGWSFAEAMRAKHLHAPIMVMTAGRDAKNAARDIGAAGYLGKPFEVVDLLTNVERLRAA